MIRDKYKRLLSSVLRLAVAGLLLWLLASSIDHARLFALLKSVRLSWLLAAFLTIVSVRFVMAVRWQWLLRSYGLRPRFFSTVLITYLSSLGAVLPGGVGPDVVRGYQMARMGSNVGDVTASIIVDRLIGLYSMLFVALGAAILATSLGLRAPWFMLLLLQALFFASWAALYLVRRWGERWSARHETGLLSRIMRRPLRLVSLLTDVRRIKELFAFAFILSFLVQALRCLMFFFLFLALGASVDLIPFFVYIPLVFVIMFVPISIGGLGVREAALILFWREMGIADEISFGAGILSHALMVALLTVALPLWIVRRYLEGKHPGAGSGSRPRNDDDRQVTGRLPLTRGARPTTQGACSRPRGLDRDEP